MICKHKKQHVQPSVKVIYKNRIFIDLNEFKEQLEKSNWSIKYQ